MTELNVSVIHSITALLLISAPSFYYLPFNSMIFHLILYSFSQFFYLPCHCIIFNFVLSSSIQFCFCPFYLSPIQFFDRIERKQGRIHGHQLQTGGQGRKCAFSHFSTRVHGPTDRPPLIELRVRN